MQVAITLKSCHFAEFFLPKYPKFWQVACIAGINSSVEIFWQFGVYHPQQIEVQYWIVGKWLLTQKLRELSLLAHQLVFQSRNSSNNKASWITNNSFIWRNYYKNFEYIAPFPLLCWLKFKQALPNYHQMITDICHKIDPLFEDNIFT